MSHDRHVPAATTGTSPLLRLFYLALVPIGLYFLVAHAFPRLSVTEAGYGDYYWHRRHWLLAHVVFGLVATLLGPLQFMSAIRRAQPALHRWTGRIYLASVALSAGAALYLASTSAVTTAYTAGLLTVASLWLVTGWLAYDRARHGRFADHRRWMIRNYTITFFFILFFAFYDALLLAEVAGWETVASVGVWICWILPLTAVEVWLRRN